MATLLTCPICCQPGFSNLDSLCHGLISAATRQLICPVCEDVLLGLDKFTIHLFSHSLQHSDSSQLSHNGTKVDTIIFPTSSVKPVSKENSKVREDKVIACKVISENNHSNNFKRNTSTEITPKRSYNVSECLHTKKWDVTNEKYLPATNKTDISTNYLPVQTVDVPQNLSTKLGVNIMDISYEDSGGTEEGEPYETENLPVDNSKSLPDLEHVKSCEENKNCHSSLDNLLSINNENISNLSNISINVINKAEVKYSQRTDTKGGLIECNVCGFSFRDTSILQMHQQLVHSYKMKGKLEITQKNAEHNEFLRITVEEKRQFPCHLCHKSFKMRGSLMVHLRVVHGTSVGSLKTHPEPDLQTEQRSYICNTCSKSFKKEQHLSQHLKTHEGKQWECDVCSKLFTTKYFLKKHKRLHTGEMPYSCSTCNKTFTFQQSYHKHLLYHSDEKPHVCTECDRAFKELSTLHNHLRIHTGEKPFACETCGKCFRQRVSYLVHRRIHTGVMPYKCTACGKSFRYKVSQRTHKCSSQPPGTVVRQSGGLVQKLLLGVQRRAAQEGHSIIKTSNSVELDSTSRLISENILQQQTKSNLAVQQQEQLNHNNQFIIFLDSSMQTMIPQNLLVAPTMFVLPREPGSGAATTFPTQLTDTTAQNQQKEELWKWKGAIPKSNKKSLEFQTNHYKEFQSNDLLVSNESFLQTREKELPGLKVIENSVPQCSSSKFNLCNKEVKTNNCNTCIPMKNEKFNNCNCSTKNNLSSSDKDDLKLLQANKCDFVSQDIDEASEKRYAFKNKIENFWIDKTKDTKPKEHANISPSERRRTTSTSDSCDLIVETTDFLSMVMSPSSLKSLPSPSEGLRHLTLSPMDDSCFLKKTEEGLYQFLVESAGDEPSADLSHELANKLLNARVQSENNEFTAQNISNKVSECSIQDTNTSDLATPFTVDQNEASLNQVNINHLSTNTEPLQTINEESLKQLLYGGMQ